MQAIDVPNLLLDEFGERMTTPRAQALWREVLVDPARAGLRYEYQQVTLLCADHARHGDVHADFAEAVGLQDGREDPSIDGPHFAVFEHADDAMGTALDLQRRSRAGHRIGLMKGVFLVARFRAAGRDWCVPGEAAAMLVMQVAARAGVGTIQTNPATYEALEAGGNGSGWGMVTTEFIDSRQADVSITLPPPACSEMSTFAGLGRH